MRLPGGIVPAACVILLSWALPAAGDTRAPGIDAADRRVAVDAGAWPWSAIGRLAVAGRRRCTASLIGPREIVTAAHCLFDRRTGRDVPPDSIHFLQAYQRGHYKAHAVAISYVTGAGSTAHPDPARDWAVVTLAAPLGDDGGFLPLGAAHIGEAVAHAGYGEDRAEILTADPACHITGGTAVVALDDCEATRGNSGGPVLRLAHGGYRLVAIQIAMVTEPGARVLRLAVPATQFAAAVRRAAD